jgi:membrane protease YdiL (CAAX protease family)
MLWLMWGYLGGKGWPQSTSDTRRHHLRAKRRSARTYLWSFAAGVLSVVALAGYWIVLFRLVKMPPNSLPDVSSYPRITIALMILMGSLVAPFMEEAGFRGYFQVALEREFRGSVAVAVSSLVFAFAHMYGLLLDRCNASVIRDQTQQELTSRICREQGRTFRNKQKPTNSVLDALLIARASQ